MLKVSIIIGILLASILIVAGVGGAIEYFTPTPIRPFANTIVINSTEQSYSYGYFANLVKTYNLEVDWYQATGEAKWIDEELQRTFKNNVHYGEIESGIYDRAIFTFSTVYRTMYIASSFDLNSATEISISKAKFCKENDIKAIGVSFVSIMVAHENGYIDSRVDEKATYDVINEFAKYLDVLLVHCTEIVDSWYHNLAEKYEIELIILGEDKPQSIDYWYDEVARCLNEMGI